MIEIVESQAHHLGRTVLIERDDSVWVTFSRPWWDLASWLWWGLTAGPKKWVLLRVEGGRRVRVRAVRIAKKHVRLG